MAPAPDDTQLSLFGFEPAAQPTLLDAFEGLADALPARVHLGTSTWSFPGWAGLVYPGKPSQTQLARRGLQTYARHRFFRTVGIDRTFYSPLDAAAFQSYASDVPPDFRFVTKAHEWLTTARFPVHPRYGAHKGAPSPHFLDARYATEAVVEPWRAGLGDRAGPLVFQFPPQDLAAVGGPQAFLERLHAFLKGLPQGPLYAIEVRNESLMTPALAQLLADVNAVPVLSVWGALPPLFHQAELLKAKERHALVIRWNLRRGLGYEEARERYLPFDQLVDEDVTTRTDIAELVITMAAAGKSTFVTANNKAEGSAPWTIVRLAERIAAAKAR